MTTPWSSTSVAAAPPRPGSTLGVGSFISAGAVLLWVLVMLVLGFVANTSRDAANAALLMFFAGFVVVPIGFIVSIVLGILALTRNGHLGKTLAKVGLLLLLVLFLLAVIYVVFGGWFGFFLSTL